MLKNISLEYDKTYDEYFIINRKTSDKIIGLKNVPKDNNGIYKIFLSKLLNKKKSIVNKNKNKINSNLCNQINVCIYIEIDFKKLVDHINVYKDIPSSVNFFLTLKRNYLNEINQEYSVDLKNTFKGDLNFNTHTFNTINIEPTIINYNNVLFDYINSRFFLNKEEYKLFQRSAKLPHKKNHMFLINDFDIPIKPYLLNQVNQKRLIICENKKITSWISKLKTSYTIINKIPYDINDIKNSNTIILPLNLLYSNKYKNYFKTIGCSSNINLSYKENIYNEYLLELIQYKRDPENYNSKIFIQLLNWDTIIFDGSLNTIIEHKFLYEMLDLFSCELFIYYNENRKSNLCYDDIRKMLNQILGLNIPFLNSYLLDKYQPNIFYNHSNKKYNSTIPVNYKKLIIGENGDKYMKSLDINKQLKFVCFPNIVKKERFKCLNLDQIVHLSKTQCTICLENIDQHNLCLTECNHVFCNSCIKRHSQNSMCCPNCRKKITKEDLFKVVNINKMIYSNENNKLRDILNRNYDLILTKYPGNMSIISNFLKDHLIPNQIISETKNIQETSILIDDYENLDVIKHIKNIKSVLILEQLYSNDRYYNYKLNSILKGSKMNITCYTYNLSNLNLI